MVNIRSRKFCCCLPVRFGVFCESILGLVVSGFFAVIAFILAYKFMKRIITVSNSEKIAIWAIGSAMTVLALTSLLGLVGAILRRRNLVQIYAGSLTIVTLVNIAAGVFAIYNLFHGFGANEVQKCEQTIQNSVQTNITAVNDVTDFACNSAFKAARIVVVVVFVVFWIVEIYGCMIAFDYVGQLEEEADAKMRYGEKAAPAGGPTTNVTIMQAPAPAPYAFSSPKHSYGP